MPRLVELQTAGVVAATLLGTLAIPGLMRLRDRRQQARSPFGLDLRDVVITELSSRAEPDGTFMARFALTGEIRQTRLSAAGTTTRDISRYVVTTCVLAEPFEVLRDWHMYGEPLSGHLTEGGSLTGGWDTFQLADSTGAALGTA
jgi:hypothetical protein